MPPNLMEPVQEIIDRIKATTGKAIRFEKKSDLGVPVTIKMADKDASTHLLLYNPSRIEEINYAIANQCGYILRLYSGDEHLRYIPVANKRTMMTFLMETDEEIHSLSPVFGKDKINQMVVLWYEGILYQLTRMPPEIMVNKWIYDEYPELRALQINALSQQRETAVMSLSQDLRRITPAKVYSASNIMNYVFFKVLEDYFHLDYVAPYHSTIFIFDGTALAKLTENEYVNSHEGDREMISRWASHLGLEKWFEWKPMDSEHSDE